MATHKKRFGLCLLAIFALLQTGLASAATLSLSPANVNAVAPGSFDVDVILSDLPTDVFGDQVLVGGYNLAIGYDSSLLTATGVTFGGVLGSTDPLDLETLAEVDTSTPGILSFKEASLLFLPFDDLGQFQTSASLHLATLSFFANSVGSDSLTFLSLSPFPAVTDNIGNEIFITEFLLFRYPARCG